MILRAPLQGATPACARPTGMAEGAPAAPQGRSGYGQSRQAHPPQTAQNRLAYARGQATPRAPAIPTAQTQPTQRTDTETQALQERSGDDEEMMAGSFGGHACGHRCPRHHTSPPTSSTQPHHPILIISSSDHQAAHASPPRHLAIPSPVHLIHSA